LMNVLKISLIATFLVLTSARCRKYRPIRRFPHQQMFNLFPAFIV
jgi:hypothetical protein